MSYASAAWLRLSVNIFHDILYLEVEFVSNVQNMNKNKARVLR